MSGFINNPLTFIRFVPKFIYFGNKQQEWILRLFALEMSARTDPILFSFGN